MARRQENTWQFKFSSILAVLMFALIVGYFIQSFTEMRKLRPVQVAMEHISSARIEQAAEPTELSAEIKEE